MITYRPKAGSLLRVKTHGLLGVALQSINKKEIEKDVRWYVFDSIAFVDKDETLLYLGDEYLMVSHWELLDYQDYFHSDEYFKKFLASLFLRNDKKIYVFYDDHYDLWDPECYFDLLK